MTARAFITGVAGPTLTRGGALVPARGRAVGPHPVHAQHRHARAGAAAGRRLSRRGRRATRRCWSIRKAAACSGSARRTGRAIRPAPPTARSTIAIRATGLEAARLGGRLIAGDLLALGIDVDCLPVADVPVAGADPVIGDRAYGDDARRRSRRIAGAVADGPDGGRRAAGAQASARPRPGDGRQPPAAAGGRRRPRDTRSDRFCRLPAARRPAAGR